MDALVIRTPRLDLVLQTPEEALAFVAAMPPAERAEVSPDWLARVRATPAGDPWALGFSVLVRKSRAVVGHCGFKGPPDADGAVELAYGIDSDHRGRGYATEVVGALAEFAFTDGRVRRVRAHTKPDNAASARVLTKCRFVRIGEVVDHEDGLVCRWERTATGERLGTEAMDARVAASASRPLVARPDPWEHLRRHTAARLALGRAGGSLPTAALLDFQLDHARARDAVHLPFEAQAVAEQIAALGVGTVLLDSAAPDRESYLRRPELGRRLSDASRTRLTEARASLGHAPADAPAVAVIVADGLSALAAHRHAGPLLNALLPRLADAGMRVTPVAVVRHARVAIEDEIGAALGAVAAVILLGERPGLAAPDSLGAYLVYAPRPGRTDAERNCVSNIRPEGLGPAAAASKIATLLREMLRRRLSGVALKDDGSARAQIAG